MSVRYVQGVPRWFTYLRHVIWRRRCRRTGHVGRPVQGGVCVHCGYEWYT